MTYQPLNSFLESNFFSDGNSAVVPDQIKQLLDIGDGTGYQRALQYYLQLHLILVEEMVRCFPESLQAVVDYYMPFVPPKEEGIQQMEIITAHRTVIQDAIKGLPGPENALQWHTSWRNWCSCEVQEAPLTGEEPVLALHQRLCAIADQCFTIENIPLRRLHSLVRATVLEHLFGNAADMGSNGMGCQAAQRFHQACINEVKKKLIRLDRRPIPDKTEIRLFLIARNESLRLPHFLDYYTRLGVDRIFVISNNSTDDTCDIALKKDNVHVFTVTEKYNYHWNWMEYLLEQYGKGNWCMVVDADELFAYPHMDEIKLDGLIAYLEKNSFSAMRSLLLDMYSENAVSAVSYKQQDDPLEYCPFFDPLYFTDVTAFFDKKKWQYFESKVYAGGMRFRVFGNECCVCLTKFPLFKYTDRSYLVSGMHALNGAEIADIEGVVFHTKYLGDFIMEAAEEAARKQHFNGAFEYQLYHEHIKASGGLQLKYSDSVRYEGTSQLIDLGFMKSSPALAIFAANRSNPRS